MRSINKAQLVGHVASNPEMYNQADTKKAEFPIAINRDWGSLNNSKKDQVDFFKIIAFERMADVVCMHLVKGSPVMIEGRLQNTSFDGTDGKKHFITEIVLDSLSVMVYKKTKEGIEVNHVCVSDQSTYSEDKLAKIEKILSSQL